MRGTCPQKPSYGRCSHSQQPFAQNLRFPSPKAQGQCSWGASRSNLSVASHTECCLSYKVGNAVSHHITSWVTCGLGPPIALPSLNILAPISNGIVFPYIIFYRIFFFLVLLWNTVVKNERKNSLFPIRIN